jgi:hypothetical protein
MAEIARRALESGPRPHLSTRGPAKEPVVADVWIEHDLGFVLLLHCRDEGCIAEEVYYSLCGLDDGERIHWADCGHLSGGLLGFDPADSSVGETILAGRAMTILTESESMICTGRVPEDDGWESVHIVELLVAVEADVLEIRNPAGPPPLHRCRPLSSRLALLVLLPGDYIRVRAARSTESGCEPVGDAIELEHSGDWTTDGWL